MRLLCLGAILLLALTVEAHQQRAAFTQVLFNTRSQHLEIAHRFSIHDAEHYLQLINLESDLLGSEHARQDLYQYALHHFSLSIDGLPVGLTSLGFEITGPYFWVYQETILPDDVHEILIQQSSFTDLWHDQINTVNVEYQDQIQTLLLSADSTKGRVYFETSQTTDIKKAAN